MKGKFAWERTRRVWLTGFLLLLLITVPVLASPSISSISPTSCYRGDSVTITIKGTGFDLPSSSSTAEKHVKLVKDGESTIYATSISSDTSTKIVARFSIGSSKEKGDWSVVVVNDDDSEDTYEGFIISDEMTISSISPTSASTDDDDVDVTLKGSGLEDVTEMYLYKSGYDNISATDIDASSTTVKGNFDLSDAEEKTYKVCVMDSNDIRKCNSDVTFEVTSDDVGEVEFTSSPSGANVYVDSTYFGVTPYTMKDVLTGSHVVKIAKDGYMTWSSVVTVTAGKTATVSADLTPVVTTVITTVPTPTPTPAPTTPTPALTPVSTPVPTTVSQIIQVQDSDRKALANATVLLNGNVAGTTGSDGQLSVQFTYDTAYTVTVTCEGYLSQSVQQQVSRGNSASTLTVTLEKDKSPGFWIIVGIGVVVVLIAYVIVRLGGSGKQRSPGRRNEL